MKELIFKPGPEGLRQIELFMDALYENLFINETYYGNLIISLNTLNNWLYNLGQKSEIKLTYKTNHKHLKFIIEGVENQIYTKIKKDNELNNRYITLELLNQLCDIVQMEKGNIVLDFEIGALHNSIYKARVDLLQAYFEKERVNLLGL